MSDVNRRSREIIRSVSTVSDSHLIGVETHILDFSGNVYGKEAEVCFLHYIRPEQKFASIEELQAQMERDVMTSRQFDE